MRVAIVDDSLSDVQYLYENMQKYCREHHVHMFIEQFLDESAFLNSLKEHPYDLVILDIYMKQINGDKVAGVIRKYYPNCQIIFTTASKDHAVQAFRLRALDYLVKPYSYKELEASLNHFEKIFQNFVHYIELKESRQFTRILISDIVYTDYHNHYIQVHTTSNVVRSYMSFDNFSPMLKPYPQFLWCYRNCMVNMDYIESLEDGDFLLKTGMRLPVSKGKRQEVMQTYANYMFDYVNRRCPL